MKLLTDENESIIRKYADKAESIYQNQTAGDNSWLGFLVTFLRELELANSPRCQGCANGDGCYADGPGQCADWDREALRLTF